MVGRIRVWLVSLTLLAGAIVPALAFQPGPAAQEGFVPVTGVPPGEQLPAAPLVIGAYAFFLLLMMFYLWTIWRRIGKVEADMRALERRQGAAPGSHAR
jgi:hypothetical protein